MSYTRKTKDVYFIYIRYPYCNDYDRVDFELSLREARELAKTYRDNEIGADVRVVLERVPIDIFDSNERPFSPVYYDKPLKRI